MSTPNRFFRQKAVQQELQLAKNANLDWTQTDSAKNAKKWITRYRRNWDILAQELFEWKLYPVQLFKLHMMGVADTYWDITTRGGSKSFLAGAGALCALALYPYAEIVITSETVGQASRIVEQKIKKELICKMSPYLRWMYEHEYLTIRKGTSEDGYAYVIENKLNGATLIVAVCAESARGIRSTFTIYEEARRLKKNLIDSVFEPMGHNRPTPYLAMKEYQTSRWIETSKSIYITSTRYEWEWFIRAFRKAVALQYSRTHERYVTVAEDIFTAIWDGSRTWSDYRKAKRQMSDSDFRMEIMNETQGLLEDSFFNLKQFVDNQEIEDAFVPPTDMQVFTGSKPTFRPKDSMNEVRIIGVDFAFANKTGKTGVDNDNTIIECFSGIWKDNHFERRLEYIEQWEASDSTGAAWRVRELRQDFDADYVVPDLRSGGETIYNIMTEYREHEKRGYSWDAHGLTVSDKMDYQVISQGKIDDLIHRTVDPHAIPCIIGIIGGTDINSNCWMSLRHQLELGNIKFLTSLQNKQEILEDTGEYFKLSSEELAEVLAPYGETDLLIQEAVKLNIEIKQDKIVLKEDRNKTKDRVVVLSYVNYIFDKIENAWNKQLQEKDDFDIDDLELVF